MSLPEPIVVVALGSNLGDSRGILEEAFQRLQALSPTAIQRSSIWETEPVDCPPGSPPFANAVVVMGVASGETAGSLLGKLQALEVEFGRRPKEVMNEPRPLDLDLILFGRECRNQPGLILPHPRARLRRFVLGPLCEIAPELPFPAEGKTARELLAGLPPDQEPRARSR